jgi:hypothetical protein
LISAPAPAISRVRSFRCGAWRKFPRRTSCPRALLDLLVRGHFVSFGNTAYPAHIVALLRKDFERMFREASFGSPEFRCNDDGGLPRLPRVTWQKISFGLLRALRYSEPLIADATKPSERLAADAKGGYRRSSLVSRAASKPSSVKIAAAPR